MPVFEIQTPDGRTLDIEAGDEATAIRGAQEWYKTNPQQQASPASGARAAATDQRPPDMLSDAERYGPGPTPVVNDPLMPWLEGVARSGAQGATLGYGDEIAATMGAIGAQLPWGSGKSRQEILTDIRGQEKAFSESNPGSALTAEIAGTVAPGVGVTNALMRAVPWLTRAPSVVRAAIAGGASSAPIGAVTATGRLEGPQSAADYASAAGEGALTAGGIGAATGGAGHAIGNVVRPWATAAARSLHDRGVRLTPGELLGGIASRSESGAVAATPGIGNLLRNRADEGVESLNRAAWDEALSPMGRRYALPQDTLMGHEAMREATDIFSRRYAAVVPRMTAQLDNQLISDIAGISRALPQSVRPQFADAMRRYVDDIFDQNTGVVDGRGLQHTLEGLRKEARNLQTAQNSNAYDRDLGEALNTLRDRIVDSAGRYTPQRTMTAFNNIQRAYRNFTTLRQASSSTAAPSGVFSPTQLHAAVRSSDKSAGKGAMARGQVPLQELSDAAKTVMTTKGGGSPTAERGALIGAIAGAAANPPLAMKAAILATPPLALYSHAGNALFRRAATAAPAGREALGTAIQDISPYAAPVTAQELNRLLQQ